jgi:hypothetical protein
VVSGNDVLLSGYDFSLEGGWQVDVTGKNATIENSYFRSQATAQTPIYFEPSAVGGTVEYNTIDGNSTNDLTGGAMPLVYFLGAGNFTLEYNYMHDSWGHPLDIGGTSTTINATVQYNLFKNTGISPLQHGDFIFTETNT